MELKNFEFDLPERLIAQRPLPERDSSRLMAVSREAGTIDHRSFKDLSGFLRAGDVLVLNDTKVIPTRLFGAKTTGGKVELLLVEKTEGRGEWHCLSKPSLKPGARILFDGFEGEVAGHGEEGLCTIRFSQEPDLEKVGRVPLPPYIRREADETDRERYQTIFAGPEGAVAAPTAGLHFTDGVLNEIKAKGVIVRHVTLHTGPGTFMPVRTDRIEEHRMMRERYGVPEETFEAVASAKKEGRRVVAVGTTSTRALEASLKNGVHDPILNGATDLFIYPGYHFRAVDALLTNFHLPGSTLLMLVAAFAGRELILKAYMEAVQKGYRFFSYGDAMLLL